RAIRRAQKRREFFRRCPSSKATSFPPWYKHSTPGAVRSRSFRLWTQSLVRLGNIPRGIGVVDALVDGQYLVARAIGHFPETIAQVGGGSIEQIERRDTKNLE